VEWHDGIGLNRILGIYKTTGDRLEICLRPLLPPNIPESQQRRPKDFRTDLILWILTRQPAPKAAVEEKKIAPEFSTAQKAFESHRLAMLHHDWTTAYRSYLPDSQIRILAQQIEWTGIGSPNHSHENTKAYFNERNELLKKYGVERFDSNDAEYIDKLRALPDPQAFYVEAMELQTKHKILKEPIQWGQMKTARMELKDSDAYFYYKFQRVFDKKPLDRLVVMELQNGNWGVNVEKTYLALGDMIRDLSSLERKPSPLHAGSTADGFRTWTSADGKHKIEAWLRSIINKVAQLEKTNGKISKVPLEKLSEKDQQFIADKVKK
jgi:hypothetical protein